MTDSKVACNECGKVHQIAASAFEYESVGADERQMGPEITFEATVELDCDCGNSISVTRRFWEYPEGVENDSEEEVSGARSVNDATA